MTGSPHRLFANQEMVLGSGAMQSTTLVAVCCVAATTALDTQVAVDARMQAVAKALGVQCTYCHVAGEWSDASKPLFDFARRMSRMVEGPNRGPLNGLGEIACWRRSSKRFLNTSRRPGSL